MTKTSQFIPKKSPLACLLGALTLSLFLSPLSRADYQQRFSLGAGIVSLGNPSETEFEVGAEYEYRLDPFIGMGAVGNYVFSSPGITLIGAPEFFLHPLGTEFLVSATPLFEFGGNTGTHVGTRLGTRLPIPMGVLTLVPSFNIDFIAGGEDLIFGIGIEF